MEDSNTEDTERSSDEGKNRTGYLFSKNFREYLESKQSSKQSISDISGRKYDFISQPLYRECSESSCETSTSESSKKSSRKGRRKKKDRQPRWDFHSCIRNRLTQCSLQKNEVEVVPPEDLKPLLVNMTILLQDLKQSPSGWENLYNLISKITILVTEFIRRPLKKVEEQNKGEYAKKAEKTIETMMTLLQEYKDGPNLDPDNSIREYKRIEREISQKDAQIADAKKKLSGDAQTGNTKVKDLEYRVKASILANEKLRCDIRFNQAEVKKFKKILLEKEWTKHKLESELNHMKKKLSKADLCDSDSFDRSSRMFEPSDPSIKVESSHSRSASRNKLPKIKKGKEIQKATVKSK